MTAKTIPMLSAPITLASAGSVDVTYDLAGVVSAVIAAGTYYILGSGASPCLLYAMKLALEAVDPDASTWTIGLNSDRKITVLRAPGTDESYDITVDLTLMNYGDTTDLGFASSVQTLTSEAATATYRPRHIWVPEEADFYALAQYMHTTTRGDMTPGGLEVLDNLGTTTKWTSLFPAVKGALVLESLASQASHAGAVSNLTTGDPHAALESWIVYMLYVCDGLIPAIKWTPNVASLGTSVRDVRVPGALLSSVDEWGTRRDNPCEYELQFTLTEVPS